MADEKQKKPRKEFPFEMEFELRQPITLGNKDASDSTTYERITLREPTVSQLSLFIRKARTDNAIDSMKFLISAVSGVPVPVLEKVGTVDYFRLQEYLMFFITPPEEDDPEGNAEGSQ